MIMKLVDNAYSDNSELKEAKEEHVQIERHYETRQIQHPTLTDRKITLVYIDNELDPHALSFLVHEARNGGRQGNVSGKMTHVGRAYKIIELYRELDMVGLHWSEAEEYDIKKIRNRMLCWDMQDNNDYGYYDYEPIENDTMNQKLAVWLKFFKYQTWRGEHSKMELSTKKVKVWQPDAFLQHIHGTKHNERFKMVERWNLMVKPSPRKLYYPALNQVEYEAFISQLRQIDIVYESIARIMVDTGLRITAALEFDMDTFVGWFRHVSIGGKTMDDEIPVSYINKGGDRLTCSVTLQTIHDIQKIYRARNYEKRLQKYQEEFGGDDEPLWIREDGKLVRYRDVQRVFKTASHAMGRKLNTISPHHLRHTCATWLLLRLAKENNIALAIIGQEPHPLIMGALMNKLGHVGSASTLRYTMTAFYMSKPKEAKNKKPMLTTLAIQQNKGLQKILFEQAIDTYGDEFSEDKFDLIKYAIKQGFAVEY
jgi:integrase